MSRKWLLGVLAVACVVLVAGLYGCTTTTTSTTKDPGRLTTSEVTVTLTPSYSDGAITLNLSSVIISGDAVTLTEDMMDIFAGDDASEITDWDSISFTIIDTSTSQTPVDLCFILDNTGSMAGRIEAVKTTISSFAASLEAAGVDVQFAACAFGDYTTTKATMGAQPVEFAAIDFDTSTSTMTAITAVTTAGALADWLDGLSGWYGYDGPENPLDPIMFAYNNFSWRTGAQKIFVVVTDIECHQTNYTGLASYEYVNYPSSDTSKSPISSYYIPGIVSDISGHAVVHVVSYDYISDVFPYGDTRDLADGQGSGRATDEAVANTGGKWIELPSAGDIDFTALGVSEYITSGRRLRFDYTLGAGETIYVHVLIDWNLDGVWDAEWWGTLVGTSSTGVKAKVAAPEGSSN